MKPGLERLTVGVVGAGRVASLRHLPILSANERTTVAYVADVDGSKAGRLARAYDCGAVTVDGDPSDVPPCDVALLAIPVGSRGSYVREFADRETPVLAEKPFAPDVETHREHLRRHGTMACNYMRTQFSNLNQARELLRSRPFGSLHCVEFRESGKLGATGIGYDHYQADPDHPGSGILLERGCHSLSQLAVLFPDDEFRVDDAALSRVEGLVVDVDASLTTRDGGVDVDFRLSAVEPVGTVVRLVFDRATVQFDPGIGDDLSVVPDGTDNEFAIEPDDRWASTMNEAMYLRWNRFISAIRAGDIDARRETGLSVSQLLSDLSEGVEA